MGSEERSPVNATAEAKRHSALKRILIALAIVVALIVCGGVWYVSDYYHADDVAMAVVADEDGAADGVVVTELSDKAIAFVPEHPTAGFVFYPGAKVQPEAYAPLMKRCAEAGVLCVIVKPRFNLAILDVEAADGVSAQFPEVETWFVGGHSMGGVAAADYLTRYEDEFAGVVFLASYPAVDLSAFEGRALSVAGSNDGVLNRESLEAARDEMPASSESVEIAGGNHAYFGDYGEQAGDGVAEVSREEQQAQTAAAIAAFARDE